MKDDFFRFDLYNDLTSDEEETEEAVDTVNYRADEYLKETVESEPLKTGEDDRPEYGDAEEETAPIGETDENAVSDDKAPSGDDRAISSDLIRGHINTIILRSLYDGDKYGYEIIAEIERKSHKQYSLKQPSLYSALKRLEKDGYVTSYWGGSAGGGRRKYFSLTDEGKEISERNQTEWEYSRTVIDSLISDKDFNFDNPAPANVDMRVLRRSTSRVPDKEADDDEFVYEEPIEDDSFERNSALEAELAQKRAAFEEERTDRLAALEAELAAKQAAFEEEQAAKRMAFEEEQSAQRAALEEERTRFEESVRVREEFLHAREEAGTRREQELLEREFAMQMQQDEPPMEDEDEPGIDPAVIKAFEENISKQHWDDDISEDDRDENPAAASAQNAEEESRRIAEEAEQKAAEEESRKIAEEAERKAAEEESRRIAEAAARKAAEEEVRRMAEEAERKAEEARKHEEELGSFYDDEVERARAAALRNEKEEQNARIVEMEPFAEERAHYEQMLRDQEEELNALHRKELEEQEARIRAEEEHNYRRREQQMIHQNYLNLVKGYDDEAPRENYSYYYGSEKPETQSYTYVTKPENEREFRSIIQKLYAGTLGEPMPAPLPPEQEAPFFPAAPKATEPPPAETIRPEPAAEEKRTERKSAEKPAKVRTARSLDGVDFYDLELRAAQDGIRVATSGKKAKELTQRSDSLVHKGRALFFSALVVFLLCVAEGFLALGLQSRLDLPRFYPYFIWGTGLALLLVMGLAYLNHYGERALRQTGNLSANIILSYALCVIVIFITALAVQVDLSDIGQLATYIIFPVVYFFGIVVFGIVYYLQIRPDRDE